MSSERIAIVGIGLRYPDAGSTGELWENVLAGRRAFRRLPDERMNQADYYSPDPEAPDRFYSTKAAVLRDFEFDRVRYRVAGSTFRSTDLTHWLALDVAAHALADAGFPDGDGLPKRTTGVVLGNSLTGEFSRANIMRLRWPYVRRTVAAALTAKGWPDDETAEFLRDLEAQYKSPFPPIDEDSLAGGLANTIAGRICNYFDLHGGGYTVDGACSSSLLSVATAAKSLVEGDMDVAIAGGVDLSIDPFEVIGFAKTGALAKREMKVYDRDSNGFWPGEGAGALVLVREEDALAKGMRVYATIAGWGVSSDGKGGITRPEAEGHRLALHRAYGRAGYGLETVSYFEGHGTGTALGDETEIEALSSARRAADPSARPAALSTVKGNFGHTKAAAGVAGLIKAALAVHHQVIPPGTGHYDPHPKLTADDAVMYVPREAELWPEDRPVRAGVSAMGFGGINTHIALEAAPDASRRTALDEATKALVAGRQDAELLLFDGADRASLKARLVEVAALLPKLAFAELGDLAAALAARLTGASPRAAVVARTPEEAERKVARLITAVDGGATAFDAADGVFLDDRPAAPRLTFLFPGQGSGHGAVGAIRRRFGVAEAVFRDANLPSTGDQVATEVAQPRIVAGSLAGLAVLRELGIEGHAAVGHSLGELTAVHWGGSLGASRVLSLAVGRGRVMAHAGRGGGAMAGLATGPERALELAGGEDVVIAGYNGPAQTVLSGSVEAVDRVCAAARAAGVHATRVNVSHAFHSPMVAPAAEVMAERLVDFDFGRLIRPVYSTVTGDVLAADTDLRALLRDQITLPVRFHEAAAKAAAEGDLVVEVGPGRVLTGLLAEIAPGKPVLSVDTDSPSLASLLAVVGAAHALGVPVRTDALFGDRVVRDLPLDGSMTFLANPCETAPALGTGLSSPDQAASRGTAASAEVSRTSADAASPDGGSTLDLLRRLAAQRVELPLEAISATTHPLDDLHLSSITVGQLVNEVTRTMGRPALEATPNFATVRLGELAELIDELAATAHTEERADGEVPGVAPWVRPFLVSHVERPLVPAAPDPPGDWAVHAPDGHPLAASLRGALPGDGVLLLLPPEGGDEHVGLFLAAARDALASGRRFAVVQHKLGAAGLARTLHLEAPHIPVTLVDLADDTDAAARVAAEVAANTGFAQVRYDADGVRTVPVLRAVSGQGVGTPLGSGDVLLVTGGGKGITAECAIAVAVDSGASLALIGRADPARDAELAANLARMTAAGIEHRYERADVTSAEEVAAAVERFRAELGEVTAVLHGAGRNEPKALTGLSEEDFHATLAPKVTGLRNVLSAVDGGRIKLLVTFGSIIGRAGLRGEAHYATANDWLTELTVDFGERHPDARVLALEWSVWSGAGMGERLGVVEALMRDGITPISTDAGIAVLREVLADPTAGPVLVVSGRAAGLPTLEQERTELPLARFVDRVLVHYPGVELVTEADLSDGSDPYLGDHLLEGDLLFPAVLGMEAMTQVASALTGHQGPPVLEDVEFLRPVVVRPEGSLTVRLAALARTADTVDVVIRAEDTGFSADHFRARLRFPRPEIPGERVDGAAVLPLVPVDPVTELYGGVLFQGKRFQRLQGYRRAAARHAVAEVATTSVASWFAPFLPQDRLLADPGTRDVMMHAIQCCVPDATLLPQGVSRLYLAAQADQLAEYVVLDARERSQDGDSYTYDLDVRDPDGRLVERWEGLVLRAVRRRDGAGPWTPTMLGPYLERSLERVLGGSRAVVVEPDPTDAEPGRRAQTELAVSRALNRPTAVRHRPDGKPEVDGFEVSASHGAGLTFAAVAEGGKLGVDVEPAVARGEEDWAGLLGADLLAVRDLLVAEAGESAAVAGTRVWCALECLRKTGSTTQAVTVDRVDPDGWAVLSTGDAKVATWVTTVDDRPEPVVFAVLVGKEG
ncbi:SDR family NAD(P)-dependent oxidoreductase [Saccharothrix australiensis]|uniref:Enediyne polyketide synthase n=1 Tax=Saccharothrix australiensis TaxID=2072 RepID=A0A495W2E4_9PSEU|nr:type I polyketide synthase [Saccharothrix australiensis]RKT55197.1 enediyne polyketide synthase [Saccharothrix australiensis]